MQSLIDSSSASNSGVAQFKLRAGPCSGRKIVIYRAAAAIKFSLADAPYTQWSVPETVTENSADSNFAGWQDSEGNVHLAYTVQTSQHLAFRKLTFVNGGWTVGSETIIYADNANSLPALFKDANARLHVCWTCFDSATGLATLNYKRSTSDGAVWGAGPSDPGTALTAGAPSCVGQIVYANSRAYYIFIVGDSRLGVRRILDGASAWEDEVTILTEANLGNPLKAAMSDSGGIIGVILMSDTKLAYLESDGANWSVPFVVCSEEASAPALQFNGEIPYVIYGITLGTGQTELRYRFKNGAGFGSESSLAPETARFASVYLYNHDAAPHYQSRTLEASDASAADILTSSSHALIADLNDALYLGADIPFANVTVLLSTAGVGGEVVWEYFNGSTWVGLIPASGAYHFDVPAALIRLWSDSAHAPLDWQKTKVESWSRFWIRARVTSAFATLPIGTQITPCTSITNLSN